MDLLGALPQSVLSDETYLDEQTGLITCRRCHQPRECEITILSQLKKVPIMCLCMTEKRQVEELKVARVDFESRLSRLELKLQIVSDYKAVKAIKDDGTNKKLMLFVERYVEDFKIMKAQNTGVIFHGDVGTGKSYYAHKIVNALQKQMVLASSLSLANMVTLFQSYEVDRTEVFDTIKRFDLLVIDDLGAERATSFAQEVVYQVIDARLNSHKPTIFTTNLSIEQLESPRLLANQRIYDRVLEMAPVQIVFKGQSKRQSHLKARRDQARQILYDE